MTSEYDVVIIGAGPAGTTTGIKLAQRGRRVLILERAKFPRFHIGESITAFGFTVFKDLGVFDELDAINEVKKKGLEFVRRGATTAACRPADRPCAAGPEART